MYKLILVPIDYSARSQEAARAAIDIARRLKARIVVLHVVAPYSPRSLGHVRASVVHQLSADEYNSLAMRKAGAAVEKVSSKAKSARVACEAAVVEHRDAGTAILEEARRRKCDLIVMASSGRRGIERVFMGSVTSKVLEKANRHVLVCR